MVHPPRVPAFPSPPSNLPSVDVGQLFVLPACKNHPRRSLLPDRCVASLLPASWSFPACCGTAVQSSCLFNDWETKGLQQLLSAGCLPSQRAVIPNFNALPPLWVQGAGSLHRFSNTEGFCTENHIQLEIEIYLYISNNYRPFRRSLGMVLGRCTLVS